MKNKIFVFGILLVLIFGIVINVSGQEETEEETAGETSTEENVKETNEFDSGYACLEKVVKERGYDELTDEELAFSTLALAYNTEMQGKLREEINSRSHENLCWPDDRCRVKQTSQMFLALDNLNDGTNLIENWIIEEAISPTDLSWYLEIDAEEKMDCTLSYEGESKKITIQEDKKIKGSGGSCFRTGYDGYWLQIDEDCFEEEFEISCNKAFITTLVSRKKSGSISDAPYYVSAITNSAPADSKTIEKINSLCFPAKDEDKCDYESTLWGALALKKSGKEVNSYLPYLIAFASQNTKYLPSAFIYLLSGSDEYFLDLTNEQKNDGYWQTSTDRYYDTAIALLALQGRSAEQETSALDWIFENQQTSGCWNNILDTSFILYVEDPRKPIPSASVFECEDSGYFCVSSGDKCEEEIGDVLTGYKCYSIGKSVCCSVEIEEATPEEEEEEDTENECEERYYSCRGVCLESEEEKAYECSGTQACCGPKETSSITKETSSWWIWLLVILIILMIIAIIFRERLKILIFRTKSGFGSSSAQVQKRPPFSSFPPAGVNNQRMMPRRIIPGQRPPMQMQRQYPKEGELQDTLKKLRDMSK